MDRAYVTLDNGQEAEVIVRDFTITHDAGREPEVEIRGFLTRPSKRKHQAPPGWRLLV